MAILRGRIRRLEDASIMAPRESINIARAELIRDMITSGRRYEHLEPHELELYNSGTRLDQSLFDFSTADLLGRIRG